MVREPADTTAFRRVDELAESEWGERGTGSTTPRTSSFCSIIK
jgi:hypothetical protein